MSNMTLEPWPPKRTKAVARFGCRPSWVAKGEWIGVVWDVEIGAQDHAGRGEDVGVVVADGSGLLYGTLGSGDDVLIFDGLDPEMRREVGEVGDDGDERPAGADVVPTFVNFAIEVGDDGDEHVGGIFAPDILRGGEPAGRWKMRIVA